MAWAQSQPTITLVAGATFAATDLYKFVGLSTDAEVLIGISTGGDVIGTLLSATYTTSAANNESVTVGLLQGVGKVFMAASTRDAGQSVAASSAGFGIAPTTDSAALGTTIEGSSGSTGRIVSVLFHRTLSV